MRYGPKRVTFRFPDGSTGLGVLSDLPRAGESLTLKEDTWRVTRVSENTNTSGYDVWCDPLTPTRPMGDLGVDLMERVRKVRRWQKLRKLKREGLWR